MIRIFRHYIPINSLILWLFEFVFLFFCLVQNLYKAPLDWNDGNITFISLVISLAIVVFFASLGLYNRELFSNQKIMFVRYLLAVGVLVVIFSIVNKLLFNLPIDTDYYSTRDLIARILSIGSVLFFLRIVYLKVIGVKSFKRRILVLGAGNNAYAIKDLAEKGFSQGIEIIGFVAFKDEDKKLPAIKQMVKEQFSLEKLLKIMTAYKAQEIVFAPDNKRGISLHPLLYCKLRGYRIYSFQDFLEAETGRVNLETLNPGWFVFSDGFQAGILQDFIKRLFDIVVASLVLVLSSPLSILAILLIRSEGKGPIFFAQERVGREGRVFKLYKFRSMRPDAEAKSGPKWAEKNDNRITKVGKFMRKTRIDEIPQILNVLLGDMSFIGPRPERPYFVRELAKEIPFYEDRHTVKPGISGWAQINYPYGASIEDAKHKLSYDLYYAKNKSLLLDMIILFQTVRVVIWPQGVH